MPKLRMFLASLAARFRVQHGRYRFIALDVLQILSIEEVPAGAPRRVRTAEEVALDAVAGMLRPFRPTRPTWPHQRRAPCRKRKKPDGDEEVAMDEGEDEDVADEAEDEAFEDEDAAKETEDEDVVDETEDAAFEAFEALEVLEALEGGGVLRRLLLSPTEMQPRVKCTTQKHTSE